MKTAANLLKSKAHQSVHTIAPEASVFDALKLMADKNIGALLVIPPRVGPPRQEVRPSTPTRPTT